MLCFNLPFIFFTAEEITYVLDKSRLMEQGLILNIYCNPGGGVTPYDGLYGEGPPARGNFYRLQVYKRVGKSVIWLCKRAQRVEQMDFTASLSRDNVLFL